MNDITPATSKAVLPSAKTEDYALSGPKRDINGTTKYLEGWRAILLTINLSFAVLLVTVEISIVATALVSIADDLHGFSMTSWVVTAYLLTYTGFLIIFAKLSDIFGRKKIAIICLSVFTIFSGACAASQSITQLIILRAFQGIGASGSYSVIVAIFFEMVPPSKFAQTTSLISAVIAFAFLLGPLLGGLITELSTWRWIFLLNVPAGSTCVLGLAILLPNRFPQSSSSGQATQQKPGSWHSYISRLDFIGTTLLLCASVLLVTALEQAGNSFPWRSPLVIVCLVLSGLLWLGFFAWSRFATTRKGIREPIFPWRLLQSRFTVGLLISIFFTGMPFSVAIIQIPLRFQAVNDLSPLQAGIRLLPYSVLNPIGSIMAPYAAKRFQIPPMCIMLFGAVIQVIGTFLLSAAPDSTSVPAESYVYEGLAGLGTGLNLACLIVMTPFNVEKRDKAIAMSAMIQSRTLGGALGLAIVTTVLTASIRSRLGAASYTPMEIRSLLETSRAFSQLQNGRLDYARAVFASSYNLQMKIAAGFSVAQIPAAFLLWKNKSQFIVPRN